MEIPRIWALSPQEQGVADGGQQLWNQTDVLQTTHLSQTT